jgi:hypothetical protein
MAEPDVSAQADVTGRAGDGESPDGQRTRHRAEPQRAVSGGPAGTWLTVMGEQGYVQRSAGFG